MRHAADDVPVLERAGQLFALGRLQETDQLLAQVDPGDPAYPYALYLRAMMMTQPERRQQRFALLESACKLCPTSQEIHAALARAHAELGRPEAALALLSRLADAGQLDAALALDRGTLAQRLGNHGLAMESYDAALALDPSLADAWSGKANLLHEDGRYAEAMRCHDAAIAAQPDNVHAICNRSATLSRLGLLEQALAEAQRALALAPEAPQAWVACGCALALMDRLEQALHCFDRALRIDPAHRRALANRASTLAELGQHEQAVSSMEAALAMAQDHPAEAAVLRAKLGMLQLMTGDWTGWAAYEYRNANDKLAGLHDAHAPRWTGAEPLAGKSVLLWSEQGFGDTIQFCRYAACLAERGASVLLEVPSPLLTLCRQLPVANAHARGDALPRCDFQISMMSMPLALGASARIPYPDGYLKAPEASVRKWAAMLPPRGKRPHIGIVCSGSPHHKRNAARSMPLAAFAPLTAHARLVVLQPELTPRDSRDLEHLPGILRPQIGMADFADVAGLIANTDLVISVDTAIAHLAGALGHPLYLLLPWQAEWRWMADRRDTPWYASARLFRQASRACWDPVMATVAQVVADELF